MTEKNKKESSVDEAVKKYYEKRYQDDMDSILGHSESWRAIAKQFDKFSEK